VDVVEESTGFVERVAALDIGKTSVMACVRVPHPSKPGRRAQEVREYLTLTSALLKLADWLRCERVSLVSMEGTSDYWKPIYYLLETEEFTRWLLNARHVKNAPGRPKTDKLDAVWLAKVTERACVPPAWCTPNQSGNYGT
jgi:transposase